MDNRPKIAIVMPLATVRGGAEQTLVDLITHQSNSRYAWRVVFLEEGPLVEQFHELGVPVRVIETGRLRNLWDTTAVVRHIYAQLLSWRCDAVLSWMTKAHVYGGLAAWFANIPAVWFQHGLPRDLTWMDRLATIVPAKGVLCCSQSGAKMQASMRPKRPTRVVYPGVDLGQFNSSTVPDAVRARELLGLPTDRPIVGIVGRLQRWKGMHTFIEAVHLIEKEYPDLIGLIVGGKHNLEPEYPARLRHQINRLGLKKRILLVGNQSNVPLWMQAMDVVVHASDREPFGLVVVEAMALKKPVIASDSGGPTEIITRGVNGLLAPFEDARALGKQIARLLNDPARAKEIGQAAGHRAKDFSSAQFALRLCSGLEDFLD